MPLLHGTLRYGEDLDSIRKTGLAAGEAANSHNYDKELGRMEYVFMAPASFRFNYGFGSGILIDPAVLEKPGAQCSDQDIAYAVECLRILLEDGEFCGHRVKEIDILSQIVTAYRAQNGSPAEGAEKEMALRIVASEPFKRYYGEHYPISLNGLFHVIQATAERCRYSLFDYFDRTGTWPLSEEILIPGNVEPDYLLGHWDGGTWTEWAAPQDRGEP